MPFIPPFDGCSQHPPGFGGEWAAGGTSDDSGKESSALYVHGDPENKFSARVPNLLGNILVVTEGENFPGLDVGQASGRSTWHGPSSDFDKPSVTADRFDIQQTHHRRTHFLEVMGEDAFVNFVRSTLRIGESFFYHEICQAMDRCRVSAASKTETMVTSAIAIIYNARAPRP